VRTLLAVLWLGAYTLLPLPVVVLALIFAFEGFAALRTHPEGVGLAASAALFLVAWPLSAIAGWVLYIRRRPRTAWIVTLGTAAVLLVVWLAGLGLAVLAQ
jgi:hypothetical protein